MVQWGLVLFIQDLRYSSLTTRPPFQYNDGEFTFKEIYSIVCLSRNKIFFYSVKSQNSPWKVFIWTILYLRLEGAGRNQIKFKHQQISFVFVIWDLFFNSKATHCFITSAYIPIKITFSWVDRVKSLLEHINLALKEPYCSSSPLSYLNVSAHLQIIWSQSHYHQLAKELSLISVCSRGCFSVEVF